MRHTTTVLLAAACLALAGCSNSTDGKADAKASASTPAAPSPTPTPSEPEYTFEDCTALMEANYAADANTDVSDEPECAHLTEDEYVQAVGEVLAGHKDEILDQAADEVIYDDAWAAMDPEAQTTVCDLLAADGPESVGLLLGESVDDPSVDTVAMAEYLYTEKC
ncbi:hypothetical protein ACFWHW_03735 [Streptomyces pharetrae]|uniref:hypothetical protein n=1 Tax=Streptomyces pharetrae TaxID=291370 RepID=UPI00365732F6